MGAIIAAIRAAITLRAQLLADGMPPDQADVIVGKGLESVMGNPRSEPWHFLCPSCHDTGWREVAPSTAEAERLSRLYGDIPQDARLVKCEPCRWQQRERQAQQRKRGEHYDASEEFLNASVKSRGFTKVGR